MAVPKVARSPRAARIPTPDRAPWHASKYVRVGALGIVAVAAAVTIALVVGKRADSPPATTTTQGTVTPVGPMALTASALKALPGNLNQVIYWVGPVAGHNYELTRTTANDVFVRYLPTGVKVGTHQGEYLVVATYPDNGALAALKASNDGPPLAVAGAKGAVARVERGKPTNVHVAFPHVDYQLEIYSPSAKKALRLATSGALTPVP
jgi:hypothetical protein